MPIGFEINDFDSDADLSSTEDDNTQLPINNSNKKNKKLKTKQKKKNPLKESKIVKDKAKKKIKNMESELNDLEFFDYLKEKTETKNDSDEDINDFFTDEDLAEQFKELEKLQKLQAIQWQNKDVLNHREETPIEKRSNAINTGMSGMFLNRTNNSRTTNINATSRVNTNLPTRPVRNVRRNYRNIGRMW